MNLQFSQHKRLILKKEKGSAFMDLLTALPIISFVIWD